MFFTPFDSSLFWPSVKLCDINREHIFHIPKWSYRIWLICFMPKKDWIFLYMLQNDVKHLSFLLQHEYFHAVFEVVGRPSRNSSLILLRPNLHSCYYRKSLFLMLCFFAFSLFFNQKWNRIIARKCYPYFLGDFRYFKMKLSNFC